MVAMIDLNTIEDDETVSSGTTSPSSSAASHLSASAIAAAVASGFGSVCLELWHACAGPLISLPRRGSVMVYFPQGHLEQLPNSRAIPCDFPPHIFCRVLDVKLHADAATDEVYAQVSLVPEIEQIEQKLREGRLVPEGYEEDVDMTIKSTTSHMFCKTLTASDTSTHGGFSVPRRAAEDCFPPLDYSQQRPSHELVAKDLIGKEWRFRHIYRGQPRRHLLTTGWSAFVNKKKLVSGDAVLFLRGDDGELRLGIRRAAQIKFDQAVPSLCSQHLNHNSFTDVRNSISLRSVFSICYNPRATSSEFIIPMHKFLRSIDHPFSAGMRFKMRLETEDSAERRLTGIIAGLAETDPVGWPGSKWKCLVVRWDDMEANRLNRVSPWEIEPSGSISNSFTSPGLKRTRTSLTSANPEFMVPDVNVIGASDTRESSRFWKVLQGQEILGNPVPSGVDFQNQHAQWFPGSRGIRDPFTSNFEDSFQFRKVLQGQEMLPIPHYGRAPDSSDTCEGFPVMSSRNGHRLSAPSMPVSSPPSVLMFQQTNNPVMNINQAYGQEDQVVSSRREGKKLTSSSFSECGFRGNNKSDLVTTCKNSCRLFGFSLTEEMHVSNIEGTAATLTSPLNNGSSFAARAQFDENGTDCPNVFVQHQLEAYNIY